MKDLNYKRYHHHHQAAYHPYYQYMSQNVQEHLHTNTNHQPNLHQTSQQQQQHHQSQLPQNKQNSKQLFNNCNELQHSTATQTLRHFQSQQQQQQQHLPPTHSNYQQHQFEPSQLQNLQQQQQQHQSTQQLSSNQLLIKGFNDYDNIFTAAANQNNNNNQQNNFNNSCTIATSSLNFAAAAYTTTTSLTYLQQQFYNKNNNNNNINNNNNNNNNNINNNSNFNNAASNIFLTYTNNNNNKTNFNNNNNDECNDNTINGDNHSLAAAMTACNSLTQQQQQRTQEQINGVELQRGLTECNTIGTTTSNGNNNNNSVDKFTMDANEIVNFLANELFKPQLVSVDGIQSGVPTLTTPTLTPTTLRTIDETFMHADLSEPVNIPNQAGFKPPPLGYNMIATQYPINFNNALSSEYNDQQDSASEDSFNGGHYDDSSQATTDNSSAATDTLSLNGLNGIGNNSQTATSTTSSTRNDFTEVNMAIAAAKNSLQFGTNGGTNDLAAQGTSRSGRRGGGRRPQQPSNMSPEEEEKRRLRRERNKQAAARCRKRRVDQTNELQGEVEVLEKKRESLQNSIQQLTKEKEFLNSVIQNHRPYCEKLNNSNILLNTFSSLTTPTTTNNSSSTASASLAGTIVNPAITGIDTSLATAGRCPSPLDLKPNINDSLLASIKNEPIDHTLDSSSLDDNDDPPSPKRVLPDVATLKNASLSASLSSLNTPVMTTAPVSFTNYSANSTLNALNKADINVKPQRPNTFSMQPRNINTLALQVNGRPLTEIQGVPIQTPSTGFNFDSLMDGGTGLTPVSGPLLPTYSQTRHAQELTTPTSEPSKLVSL